MSSKRVTINEAQSNFFDLLAYALKGNEVIIADKEKKISPIDSNQRLPKETDSWIESGGNDYQR